MYKHILIATDGSALSEKAVSSGLALAHSLGAHMTALTVSEPPSHLVPEAMIGLTTEDEHDAERYPSIAASLQTVQDKAKAAGVACTTVHVAYTFPAETIVEVAKKRKCDLIVMASHGRRGLARYVLGGEAVRVLTHSEVPVLVCR